MFDPVDQLFEDLRENLDLELKYLVCSENGNWYEFSFFIRKKAIVKNLSESLTKELEIRLRDYFRVLYHGNSKSR